LDPVHWTAVSPATAITHGSVEVTAEILLVLAILAVAVVFLVTEWIPMEVVALLVLGSLAVTDLVSPTEALSGFSNPAVITIWSVFILSGGLTRTGVGNIIGNRVMALAGRNDTLLVVIIMLAAGIMSAFMNNVAVAALMLPVVMDIARSTGLPPSNLLMPLAYGSLLGGLMTQIGTPPNILVSEFLDKNDLPSFGLFDFTPIGSLIFAAGILFMAVVGKRLLPARNVAEEVADQSDADLDRLFRLQESIFHLRIPAGSSLDGKTLAASRIGTLLGLTVMGITRRDHTLLSPSATEKLRAGDELTVKGPTDNLEEAHSWQQLNFDQEHIELEEVFSGSLEPAEVRLSPGTDLAGKTLSQSDFRNRYGVMVLAIHRDDTSFRTNLPDLPLEEGDTLLIQGEKMKLEEVAIQKEFEQYRPVPTKELVERYQLHKRLLQVRLPAVSPLIGRTLKHSRIGKALGMRVIHIQSADGTHRLPDPSEAFQPEDRLVVEGRKADLDLLTSLNELEIDRRTPTRTQDLVSEDVGLCETVLAPQSSLAGRTLRQLNFREKYGLNVLSIWRRGQVHYANLRDMALDFGDALLLYGPKKKLQVLGREPDFIVLTKFAQEVPRVEKAGLASLIMAATFVPVIAGWIPIYIATVIGSAVMVLSRCLTMEEAYRSIEWRAVFLIAGMFPLGLALDQSGAARFLAEGVVSAVGPFGPRIVMLAILLLTFLATCFIPTAALVVLLAPIILSTAAQIGVSAQALMMAMAMAASASFMTPISHPANILVMGPGGYRFKDYLKIGGLLTLVVLVVIMLTMPFLWPMTS
jgi:di/tricarboxylate transporter